MSKKTNADYVAESRDRLKSAGGRRMPSGYLTPQGAADLDTLARSGYADSLRAVIERALREAVERLR